MQGSPMTYRIRTINERSEEITGEQVTLQVRSIDGEGTAQRVVDT